MNPIHGMMAQTVSPNPKCGGCLHYEAQQGPDGVCTIGLQPFTCGPGDMPSIGYAPIATAGPNLPGSTTVGGQAPLQPPQQLPMTTTHNNSGNGALSFAAMQVVALGEEHVDMVKSLVAEYSERGACRVHSANTSTLPAANALLKSSACSCRQVTAHTIARALMPRLSNQVRKSLSEQYDDLATTFVTAVRAGRGLDDIRKSLVNVSVAKGFYGQDWLDQFRSTELFDEAVALCEAELTMAEEGLKRRQAAVKARREREEHLAKLKPTPDYYDDGMYQREEAVRLKKQRLQLKLAKLQQKASTKREPAIAKSEAGLEWSKTKHMGSSVHTATASHGSYRAMKTATKGAICSYTPKGSTESQSVGGTHRNVDAAMAHAADHHAMTAGKLAKQAK